MKRLEEFSQVELAERHKLQSMLHDVLVALKGALDARQFNEAIIFNISGSKVIQAMMARDLALPGELDLLDTLRGNVNDIFRIQNRHQ